MRRPEFEIDHLGRVFERYGSALVPLADMRAPIEAEFARLGTPEESFARQRFPCVVRTCSNLSNVEGQRCPACSHDRMKAYSKQRKRDIKAGRVAPQPSPITRRART